MSHAAEDVRAQVNRLWELVVEFRFGLSRLVAERDRLPARYGVNERRDQLNTAIERGRKDIQTLEWAIGRITGEKEAPDEVVFDRVAQRLGVARRLLMVEDEESVH